MPELVAITREISDAIVTCELTHVPRQPIDVARARAQHEEYERALEAMGCLVERLPAGPDMPDSVFIEDAAVVLDEVAIVTRPGAPSRRAETTGVAAALASHRPIVQIQPPGTVDGGDVLVVGRSILVGRTARTNQDGFDQMRRALEPFGYGVEPASVRGCLHLKSAVTAVGEAALLINRRWVSEYELVRFELIDVDPAEPSGANVVRVGARLLCAAAFPRTRDLLEARGYGVTTVDASELAKAEGALTCCSLIFSSTASGGESGEDVTSQAPAAGRPG